MRLIASPLENLQGVPKAFLKEVLLFSMVKARRSQSPNLLANIGFTLCIGFRQYFRVDHVVPQHPILQLLAEKLVKPDEEMGDATSVLQGQD